MVKFDLMEYKYRTTSYMQNRFREAGENLKAGRLTSSRTARSSVAQLTDAMTQF